jgi:altronate hydrolase
MPALKSKRLVANKDRACIRLHPDDSVVVALRPLGRGQRLPAEDTVLRDDIPASHKAAVRRIPAGTAVIKYGQVIGFAASDIEPGRHVHAHNVSLHDFSRDFAYGRDSHPTAFVAPSARRTFEGFLRPDPGGRAEH